MTTTHCDIRTFDDATNEIIVLRNGTVVGHLVPRGGTIGKTVVVQPARSLARHQAPVNRCKSLRKSLMSPANGLVVGVFVPFFFYYYYYSFRRNARGVENAPLRRQREPLARDRFPLGRGVFFDLRVLTV